MNRNYNATNYPSSVLRPRGIHYIRSCLRASGRRRRRSPSPFSPLLPVPSPALTRIVEQDESVLHVLATTSDRDKSLPPLCSSQYLSLSFPHASDSSSLLPSVYFKFSRYIRPCTIQDKTFSSVVLPAGSLNGLSFDSSVPDYSSILLYICVVVRTTHIHIHKCRTS